MATPRPAKKRTSAHNRRVGRDWSKTPVGLDGCGPTRHTDRCHNTGYASSTYRRDRKKDNGSVSVKTTLIKLRLIAYKHYTRFVHDRVLPNLSPSCPVLLSPMDGTLSIGIVETGKDGTDGATDSAHAQIVISLTPTSTLRPQNGTLYAASVAGNNQTVQVRLRVCDVGFTFRDDQSR